jgi:hypothetical protein
VFQTDRPWNAGRPDTLVVACSDGRLQVEIDAFLATHLGIANYDRFYVPGGAGALASSGLDFVRPYEYRAQCRVLAAAHGTRHAILLFHGPAPDGPDDAVCLDYRRKLPGRSADAIREEQDRDARELLEYGMGPGVALSVYRCEVRQDGRVQVVSLDGSPTPARPL